MNKQTKKLIAPIIITILLVMYFIGFIFICILNPFPLIGKIIGIVIPLVFTGTSVYVLFERIKEIRSGEEDDLSKY